MRAFLRRARFSFQLTQAELGKNYQAIGRLERGVHFPQYRTILDLAAGMGCDLEIAFVSKE